MSFINYSSREINCKIVYYGPGLCGKTTNLQYVYAKTNPEAKGKMISLATETERTLFFDFLPLDLGQIKGFKVRFHLYTVPGQTYYNASRKLILKGVDGIVFVADSQVERMEANQEAMQNLYDNMAEYGYDLTKMPFVIQYNKRDLPNAAPLAAAEPPGPSQDEASTKRTPWCSGRARIRAARSSPLRVGMIRSISTRSNGSSCRRAWAMAERAASASPTAATPIPSASR